MNYFDINDYINPQTHRYYIVGKRGAGKSYSIKKKLLKDIENKVGKFVLVKSYTSDISVTKMNKIFSDVESDPELNFDKLGYGDFYTYHILFKSGDFYLVGETDSGDLEWLEQIGTAQALSQANRFKGGVYNDYKNIFYDEFINEEYATYNEVEMFNKILLTVSRSVNENVNCFFAGNPDSGIERSSFLYPLKLDYKHLTNNSPYYFDTKVNDKTYANNVLFIKIAGGSDEYINTSAIDVANSEIDMSLSGEVKTGKYCNKPIGELRLMEIDFELIVETPIITENEYHKKIYSYIGRYLEQPAIFILTHRIKRQNANTLYCRYEATDIRPRPYYQTFRLNIPAKFAPVSSILKDAINTQMILTNDNSAATLFFDILENG